MPASHPASDRGWPCADAHGHPSQSPSRDGFRSGRSQVPPSAPLGVAVATNRAPPLGRAERGAWCAALRLLELPRAELAQRLALEPQRADLARRLVTLGL